jgi:hypothetical protein
MVGRWQPSYCFDLYLLSLEHMPTPNSGDKARFNAKRKRKLARRLINRALRKELPVKASA